MIAQPELITEEVQNVGGGSDGSTLKSEINNYKCDRAMLHNVLLSAAMDGESIETAWQGLNGLTTSNTVRAQLNAGLKQHKHQMNEALTALAT